MEIEGKREQNTKSVRMKEGRTECKRRNDRMKEVRTEHDDGTGRKKGQSEGTVAE